MMADKILFGTKEWAPHNFNFMNGCSNDCVYCYAKDMAIRFKRKTSDTWREELPVSLENKSFNKKNGAVMIPSSHDITPGNIKIALYVMEKLIKSGNELLLVTKPHLSCVKHIVDKFETSKGQIKFRFTIGSADSQILKLWEPGAPSFQERFSSLTYAFERGYSTSISCEPLLDNHFDLLYEKVVPFITGSIWVGKINMAVKRVRTNTGGAFPQAKVTALLETQTDEKIIDLFNRYKKNAMIEWKESIKKVVINHGLM
ncbi:MAG: radical SAM protein [Sphaerochaetaceae bacterium]|jgi:DNA repair photolyase|nr:radical SAM protein [Sphaerochaetaceae bacterium]